MKKIQLIFISLLLHSAINGQQTIESNSPYSAPRYHYFVNTILVSNEYLDTNNGSFNTTQLRVLFPIGSKAWNLRFDLPLISANTNSENKTGIGDVGAGISYIPYREKNKTFAFRTKVYANSASDTNFGSGKWVIMPAFFFSSYLKNKKILWITSIEYQASFAGSSQRSDVSVIAYENLLLYSFGRNWISGDLALRYNSILKGFQNNVFLELGRKITTSNLIYIHPSTAFGNKKTYNYGIEAGLLILF
jgi:hypothetical protein